MVASLRDLERVAVGIDPDAVAIGDAAVDIASVTLDSRSVRPGALFACVRGANVDGHDFARTAVDDGAVAVVVDHQLTRDDLGGRDVPQLVVGDVRRVVGPIAAEVAGRPSERQVDVFGVTGTNGKTTTTHLLASVLEAAGRRCGVIGTLSGARTTPEAPELQRQFGAFATDGYVAVAMEVSSHALDQHRVDGTRFRVAGFTNLGHDHLDYHGTMEAYFDAKARLFTPDLAAEAVVCIDDEAGRRLAAEVDIPVTTYSVDEVTDLRCGPDGSTFIWRDREVALPLAGRFNVANALCAASMALRAGVAEADVVAGLASVPPVPGRVESVACGQPFTVLVDFAHTPDALDAVLGAARSITDGSVIVVFGCGGERDVDKRPRMGAVAGALADVVVLTADNSRSEDTATIISAIRSGIDDGSGASVLVEPDRRAAIAVSLDHARAGDVVVVAGRGHERHLDLGDGPIAFEDHAVTTDLLVERGWTR